jgi:MFS transporter, PHS family, inorganic phosphate transporter
MLAYIYWNDSVQPSHETTLNVVTLAGCICGMIAFGWLGDRYGRRKMYGIELLLLIVGTMGTVMSSSGYIAPRSDASIDPHTVDWESYGSMNIVSWLIWWRLISGIGIGADYPLSAVIASE